VPVCIDPPDSPRRNVHLVFTQALVSCRAPPERELAVERPRSFWQCVLITYCPGTLALMPAIRGLHSSTSQLIVGTVGGIRWVVAGFQ